MLFVNFFERSVVAALQQFPESVIVGGFEFFDGGVVGWHGGLLCVSCNKTANFAFAVPMFFGLHFFLAAWTSCSTEYVFVIDMLA
jgi:hypothetical protein